MAKTHNLIALITAAFLIIVLMIILANVNISEQGSFEDFFDNNGGLFWGAFTVIGIVGGTLKYLDIQREIERKGAYDKTVELQNIIIGQNDELKIIQLDHIKEFVDISRQLSENTTSDAEVLREVVSQTKIINDFILSQDRRDGERDKKNDKIIEDVKGMKKDVGWVKGWIRTHEQQHKAPQKAKAP